MWRQRYTVQGGLSGCNFFGLCAGVLLVCLALVAPSGCGPGLYELPDPPPREAWARHSLNPAQERQRSERDFLAAQDSVLSFVEALREARFADAYMLLSNETRILLDDLSPSGMGETILEDGVIAREGSEYQVDPLDLFVIHDLTELVDERPSEREQETYRRKEIWAISEQGDVHHLVLILEEDRWRIHKPQIELTPGAPGRRSLDE